MRFCLKKPTFGVILFLLIFRNGPAAPRNYRVSPDGNFPTISAAVAAATAGDTIEVVGGSYSGPLVIDKSVTLIGRQQPVIDGQNSGTELTLAAPGIHINGFTIRNSGKSLDHEDAGITANFPGVVIENNRIEHVLFGIYMRKSDSSVVRNNFIMGKAELPVPRRGDLVRAWYSNAVQIENNTLKNGRDLIVWFSVGSIVKGNRVNNARYGVHFMYSKNCRIEENVLTGNSVGIYLMYSQQFAIVHNTIAYNRGPSGLGVGVKDFDDGLIEENMIVDNRIGIFIDNSPSSTESIMTYDGNVLAYNDVGFSLLSFIRRSHAINNSFVENDEHIGISGGGKLTGNQWENNYWSDYAGFDSDGDHFGDIPYKSEKLFENLMDKHPELRTFLYSPAVQALDFAAKAFPMVKPRPKLTDERPRMTPLIPTGLNSVSLPKQEPLAFTAIALFIFGLLLSNGIAGVKRSARRGKSGSTEKAPGISGISSPINQETNPMIDVQNLIKRFGSLTAVNNVSFKINEGESVALWGSNGAGKTTVLRCLLGVIPFDGNIFINGFDIHKQSKAARFMIGFVPQEISFHDNLSVQETLAFYAQLKKTTPESIADWIKRLGLQPHISKTVKELSGGMKQRLALAIALLADPPILFLDEPTANLDMRSRDDFLDQLNELKNGGKTIVFSSHRLEEVFSFADRVLIVDQGKLIADAAPRDVYEKLGKKYLLRLFLPQKQIASAVEILTGHGFKTSRNGKGIKVRVNAHAKGRPINILADAGVYVNNFEYEIEN